MSALARLCRLPLILALLIPGQIQAQAPEATKVHFLLIVDTFGGNAKGLGLDLDGQNMERIIKESAAKQKLTDRVALTVFEGEKAAPNEILKYYRSLKSTPNESVVFYYTGHGGFYTDRGHRLTLGKAGVLDRMDLLNAMTRNKPRLACVLTDCCANADLPILAGGAKRTAPNPKNAPRLVGGGNGELFRDLFFRAEGIVNLTAARTGTTAAGDRSKGGSFFTLALTKLLRESPKTFDASRVDWNNFFPALETHTELESFSRFKDKSGQVRVQFHTPEAFLMGKRREPIPAGTPVPNETSTPYSVRDSLTAQDPAYAKSKNGSRHRAYPVQLDGNKFYQIDLHSAHFDTYLYVEDAAGKVVASNDDFENITRSALRFKPSASGAYKLVVSSYSPGETGSFDLSMHERTIINGELTAQDPKDHYCVGAHHKIFPMKLQAGHAYTVQLRSRTLDPYLRIEDSYGNTLALNDDEIANVVLDSKIVFRPVQTDTYYFVVTTFNPGATGAFNLIVEN